MLALIGQVVIIAFLALFTIAWADDVFKLLDQHPLRLLRHDWAMAIAMLGVLPSITGTWLTAGLPHVRKLWAMAGWGLVFVFIGAASLAYSVLESVSRHEGHALWEVVQTNIVLMRDKAIGIVMLTILTVLGMPLGHAVWRAFREQRMRRWSKRRQRLRRQTGTM